MRRALPDSCSMVVTKNRLLRVAVDNLGEEGAARWEGLKGQKGMNAYVFAPEDDVRGAVKAFNGFLEDLKVRIFSNYPQMLVRGWITGLWWLDALWTGH